MKNPHGVEPTRFMKREESDCAIKYDSFYGPAFGDMRNYNLFIGDYCNKWNSCLIHNDGEGAYECHPKCRSSLFVNTAGPDEDNHFSVLDYEVYTY